MAAGMLTGPVRPMPTPPGTATTRRPSRLPKYAAYVVLVATAVISLYPLFIMVIDSFKSDAQVSINPVGLPSPFELSSYSSLVAEGQIRSFFNNVLISTATTVGSVFLSALAGYAFTKIRFPGRTLIFLFLLATIMVPIQTAIPGFYVEFAKLHWLDTYQVQIVPFLTPVFGVFMVRQYLLSVPDEIIEAARIDGATEWRIYWRIIVPILKPVLAALAVLQYLNMWSSYIWPQVMASAHSVAPLSLTLPSLTDNTLGIVPQYGTIMAGSVLAVVPVIILFLRYQKAFVSGITYQSN